MMWTYPVKVAVVGTALILTLIVVIEVREYFRRLRDRRLCELHRR